MKLRDDFKDELDVGFDTPEPGVSIVQIQEDIREIRKEDSEGVSLRIPITIDTVLSGPDSNQGMSCSAFLALISKEGKPVEFAQDQLMFILFATGLTREFKDKFPGDIDPLDDRFLAALKLKLPGRFIKVQHDVREFGGNKQFNVKKWIKAERKSGPVAVAKEAADSDWG